MRRSLSLGLSIVLAACGGVAEPAKAPAPRTAPEPNIPVIAAEQAPLLIEYVVVHRRWVEKVVPIVPAELAAWSAAPENAAAVSGPFRQILVKVPGGEADPGVREKKKKKAQSIVARLDKGEDFGKLARQLSDDTSSKDSGGEYSKEKLAPLPPAVIAAFQALAPGKTTPEPVRSPLGFHIVHKDRASEDRIDEAYRAAKAPELTAKLAEELRTRLTTKTSARAAVADAALAVLGERGLNDANRPAPQSVPRERVQQVRLPAAAKAALETFAQSARAGDVLPSPAVDGDRTVVARAVAPDAR